MAYSTYTIAQSPTHAQPQLIDSMGKKNGTSNFYEILSHDELVEMGVLSRE